jgi:hypothetical protein
MYLFEKLADLPWIYGVLTLIVIFVIFTIAGIFVLRKTANLEELRKHHDVAGVVFANIGVLYSVLLGFTVVNVQQRFDKIKEITEVEASYLAQLYQDAEVFPEVNKNQIRNSIREYCGSVLNEEWDMLRQGVNNPATTGALKKIWQAYYSIVPTTNKEQAWYAESISKLNQLLNTRLARIVGSRESLGPEMWTMLLGGAFLMVAFIWFFGLHKLSSHILMGTILATSTAFLLFLIYTLDTPFLGQVVVAPDALIEVYKSFATEPV